MAESRDPIAELITTYNELNSSTITELDSEPSPLEFMRFVARNTPFVIRGGAADWKATRTWSADLLSSHLGNEPINVAVTPSGNADAPTLHGDVLLFAKPHEEDQPFSEFLNYVITQERQPSASHSEIRYAQTQNDNLRTLHPTLFTHVPPSIPFARIALSQPPDAINLWIGNSRSTTALHKDNYENIYVQILGRKHFVLLPPHAQPAVNEQLLRPATYARNGDKLELREDDDMERGEDDDDDDDDEKVPFAVWDPDVPGERGTKYSGLVEPVRVTLERGDMLYLPAMWWHKVGQSCGDDGVCVAVNYWYDMDFTGPLYPFSNFVRAVNEEKNKA